MATKSEIRRAAVQILLDCDIKEIPISPISIAEKLGIPVVSFNQAVAFSPSSELLRIIEAGQLDAFCCSPNDTAIIFYNDQIRPVERIRFSIAHELGHIVLKHLNVRDIIPRTHPTRSKDPIELEADIFAAELLAPQGILFATGLYRHPGKIKEEFNISYTSARARSEILKTFWPKHITKLEQKLCQQIFEE